MAKRMGRTQKKPHIYIFIILLVVVAIPIIYHYSHNDENNSSNDQGFLDNLTSKKQPKPVIMNFEHYETPPVYDFSTHLVREDIKGIFVNAPAAGSKKRLENLINLANTTEVNAFVVDVKDDEGRLTFKMDVELAEEIGATVKYIKNIDELMDKLYDNDIYPIARIVVFKDPYLSENIIDYAIKNKDGSLWKYKGISWLNPYYKQSWDYIVDIAKQAAIVGFKEIQFDYIRFETTHTLKYADLGPDSIDKTRREVILEFVKYATKELESYNVEVSADVFGIAISSEVDSKTLGQDYVKMAQELDVICPMVYPSHYGYGFFGIPKNKHSDLYPYEVIYGSMEDSNERYEEISEESNKAIVRPWLQAFTASYLEKGDYKVYTGEDIRAQIQAVYDAGLREWILWHSGSKYSGEGLLPE